MASNSLLHKPRGEMEWFSIMLQNNGLSSPLHLRECGFLKQKERKLCHFHSLPVSHNWIFPKLDIGKKKKVLHTKHNHPFCYVLCIFLKCGTGVSNLYGNVGLQKKETYLNKFPIVEIFHFKSKAIKSLKIYAGHGKICKYMTCKFSLWHSIDTKYLSKYQWQNFIILCFQADILITFCKGII